MMYFEKISNQLNIIKIDNLRNLVNKTNDATRKQFARYENEASLTYARIQRSIP